ncbi:MAG: hypothetical protein CMP61_12220 [Flavobacteriales bacterium]|nr:hypothetical protein [Flavobacteriales bacterium]|tara:strand:+ start:11103 stop:12116 length:1014 start_codon:yes stop_codon:yes gene_type:complete
MKLSIFVFLIFIGLISFGQRNNKENVKLDSIQILESPNDEDDFMNFFNKHGEIITFKNGQEFKVLFLNNSSTRKAGVFKSVGISGLTAFVFPPLASLNIHYEDFFRWKFGAKLEAGSKDLGSSLYNYRLGMYSDIYLLNFKLKIPGKAFLNNAGEFNFGIVSYLLKLKKEAKFRIGPYFEVNRNTDFYFGSYSMPPFGSDFRGHYYIMNVGLTFDLFNDTRYMCSFNGPFSSSDKIMVTRSSVQYSLRLSAFKTSNHELIDYSGSVDDLDSKYLFHKEGLRVSLQNKMFDRIVKPFDKDPKENRYTVVGLEFGHIPGFILDEFGGFTQFGVKIERAF